MSTVIDAFGEIYMAYYLGKPSAHYTERDDGFKRKIENAHYYFREYNEWEKYEQDAIKEAKGRVLDIGLGAGRHALYLKEKGHKVIGIDTSPLALIVARLRGVEDFRLMSLFDLDFPPDSFDTILMLGQNLALGDTEEMRAYLSRLFEVTSPDGIIIGEARDPYVTDNPEHLEFQRRNVERGIPAGLVRLRVGFKEGVTEWFTLFLMNEEELKDVIKPTGWKLSQMYHSTHGMYIALLTK